MLYYGKEDLLSRGCKTEDFQLQNESIFINIYTQIPNKTSIEMRHLVNIHVCTENKDSGEILYTHMCSLTKEQTNKPMVV